MLLKEKNFSRCLNLFLKGQNSFLRKHFLYVIRKYNYVHSKDALFFHETSCLIFSLL